MQCSSISYAQILLHKNTYFSFSHNSTLLRYQVDELIPEWIPDWNDRMGAPPKARNEEDRQFSALDDEADEIAKRMIAQDKELQQLEKET